MFDRLALHLDQLADAVEPAMKALKTTWLCAAKPELEAKSKGR